jgi:hypothetical protein
MSNVLFDANVFRHSCGWATILCGGSMTTVVFQRNWIYEINPHWCDVPYAGVNVRSAFWQYRYFQQCLFFLHVFVLIDLLVE